MNIGRFSICVAFTLLIVLSGFVGVAQAETGQNESRQVENDEEPPVVFGRQQPELEGVGVDENLGEEAPLDLNFIDENGSAVSLKQYFKTGKPVILTMNYSTCPQLCSLQLNMLTETMRETSWKAGTDFSLLTVSYDPSETIEQTTRMKQKYLASYDQAATNDAWSFLIGNEGQVRKFAQTIGIRYRYFPRKREYSHPAVLVVCTAEGKISSYLHGIKLTPEEFQAALERAARGEIAPPKAVGTYWPLFCSVYDEDAGVYVVSAVRVVKLTGVVMIIALGVLWWVLHKMMQAKQNEIASSEIVQKDSPAPTRVV